MFIVFAIITIALPLWRARLRGKQLAPDCLSINQTTAIRGLLVLFIFFSHFFQRVTGGWLPFGDSICVSLIEKIGQMMVAPFLFYSGFGIVLSYTKKGKSYIDSFPKKRILKTYLFFVAVVLVYLIYNAIVGNKHDIKTIALSFLGYEKIGNPNWFMFAILFMYIVTYLSARINKKRIDYKTVLAVFACVISYQLAFCLIFKPGQSWWYDTIICFPFGMLIGLLGKKVLALIKSHRLSTLAICLGSFVVFFALRLQLHGMYYVFWYNILSCFFCSLIVAICSYVKIENPILLFLGRHSFSIYIFQMIPFSLFYNGLSNMPVPFFLCSLAVTLLIALLFDLITNLPNKHVQSS